MGGTYRFQVISVVAVFVALGLGLGLGTVARHGSASASAPVSPPASALASAAAGPDGGAAQAQVGQLFEQIQHLTGDLAAQERFAEGLAPVVLGGRLTGIRVLVVATPAGVSDVDGVVAMLRVAGATVAARVELADAFTDPANADELLTLATQAPSVAGALPKPVDGVGAAAAQLAAVLVNRTPPVTDTDIASVLAAYTSHGFLRVSGARPVPADAIVLVTGRPVTGPDATARNAAVFTVAQRLDLAGALVVAGPSDLGAGNTVALVRADRALAGTVSTVDDVSTPRGRLLTAWALADQLSGRTGHYGTGTGAALIPAGTT